MSREFQSDIFISDILYITKRAWGWLLAVTVIVFLLGGFYIHRLPDLYTSTARVYLDSKFESKIQVEAAEGASASYDVLYSMEEALMSDSIALRVAERLNVLERDDFLTDEYKVEFIDDPGGVDSRLIDLVKGCVTCDLIPRTRLLELGATALSADLAKEIAYVYTDEFLAFLKQTRISAESQLREELEAQAKSAMKETMVKEAEIAALRREYPDFLLEQDSKLFADNVLQLGSRLNDVTVSILELEGLRESLEGVDAKEDPMLLLQVLLSQRNVDSSLPRELAITKGEVKRALAQYGPTHPVYIGAQKNMEEMAGSIERQAVELKRSASLELKAAQLNRDRLKNEMDATHMRFVRYKEASAKFKTLQSELDYKWSQVGKMNQRLLNLSTNPDLSASIATVVQEPVAPHESNGKHRSIIKAIFFGFFVIGTSVFSFVIGCFLKGMPFTCCEQIEEVFGVPVVQSKSVGAFLKLGMLCRLDSMVHLLVYGDCESSEMPLKLKNEFDRMCKSVGVLEFKSDESVFSFSWEKVLTGNRQKIYLLTSQKLSRFAKVHLDKQLSQKFGTLLVISSSDGSRNKISRELEYLKESGTIRGCLFIDMGRWWRPGAVGSGSVFQQEQSFGEVSA